MRVRLVPAGLLESQMTGEGVMEYLLADMEPRLSQALMHGLEVGDQPLVGGALQNADGSDHGNAQGQRFGAGLFLIDQEGISMNLLGQTNGVTLSPVT